jgi:GNAT superfamily N-acetyltransferase
MIRPTLPADTASLLPLAEQTGVFKPPEIKALEEVLDDYHASNQAIGHRAVCREQDGKLVGFAYFAPASMTDRTWYLWWIFVGKDCQAGGIGSELLRFAEEEVRRSRGRMLLVETSSQPHYELTRRFYLKHGYERATVLADFYSEGDDMVVFRKRFGK